MIWISVIFSILYFLLVMSYLAGWKKTKLYILNNKSHDTRISIIVPARNEQENIVQTLEDLSAQNYPKELFEIIVIDDDSTDDTFKLASDYTHNLVSIGISVKIIPLKSNEDRHFVAYKKRAIEKGISESNGNWIVLTDADCRRGKDWLKTFASFIEEYELKFISGPVSFYDEFSFSRKMQSLEFMSLVGIGAASITNRTPNMCNGANLAFEKKVFYEVGGYEGIDQLASGDDEFLMHKIFEKYPDHIFFLKSSEAIVYTKPFQKLKDFIKQRKRWVSKSRKYQRKPVTVTLYFVYFFHLMILFSGIPACFNLHFLWSFLILFGMKMISELIFVIPLSRFFRKEKLLPFYIPASIFYVIYVVIIGILGNTGGYEWKGRKVI